MNLTELIDCYGNRKAELDGIKKVVDGYNKDIKEAMSEMNISKASSDNYTATLSNVTSESFDEPKLIAKLKALGNTDCIKLVETVDMNAIENAIYTGKLKAAELADCKVVNSTQRLTIKKNK